MRKILPYRDTLGSRSALRAMKVFFTASLLLVVASAPILSGEGDEVAAEGYLYEGDMRMFNNELKDAEDIYEFVLKTNPRSYEALWRLSRFYVSRGMAEEANNKKKDAWRNAQRYAENAVEINPTGAQGHLYLATALAKLSLISSAGEKVKHVWKIKEELETAIELDPSEHRSYMVLGAWHRNVAVASPLEKQLAKMFFKELPEASLEESLKLLIKAVELGGTEVRNHYELALTYEALGQKTNADQEYKKILDAPASFPEDAKIKEEISDRFGIL
ncbi:MAG: hypothetical protein JW800_07980 [Candidatus Omnitrophica bacterium]|nr:hypothetical protein [Candidatus Omnitrophota bacterium]